MCKCVYVCLCMGVSECVSACVCVCLCMGVSECVNAYVCVCVYAQVSNESEFKLMFCSFSNGIRKQ